MRSLRMNSCSSLVSGRFKPDPSGFCNRSRWSAMSATRPESTGTMGKPSSFERRSVWSEVTRLEYMVYARCAVCTELYLSCKRTRAACPYSFRRAALFFTPRAWRLCPTPRPSPGRNRPPRWCTSTRAPHRWCRRREGGRAGRGRAPAPARGYRSHASARTEYLEALSGVAAAAGRRCSYPTQIPGPCRIGHHVQVAVVAVNEHDPLHLVDANMSVLVKTRCEVRLWTTLAGLPVDLLQVVVIDVVAHCWKESSGPL